MGEMDYWLSSNSLSLIGDLEYSIREDKPLGMLNNRWLIISQLKNLPYQALVLFTTAPIIRAPDSLLPISLDLCGQSVGVKV